MLWIEKPYTKIACISDPHAHLATFMALVAKIPPDYLIIVLGDLIDKGKKARDLVTLVKANYEALLGNHDHFMTVESRPAWKRNESLWLYNNGKSTIKSYGDKWKIQNREADRRVFQQHVIYFRNLPMVIELPNLLINGKRVVLSHSTISKAVEYYGSIEKLKEVMNTTDRSEFLSDYVNKNEISPRAAIQSIFWEVVPDVGELPNLNIFNVFGHTVQENGIQIGEQGAAIDCGVYKHDRMCALLLPDLKIIEQELVAD